MYDCVIPAAGASSRMGKPGKSATLKPLLPFRGSTLVETAVAAALEAGCRVLLVVGNGAAEVALRFDAAAYSAARGEGRLRLVENPRWEEGMLGSIQAALPSVTSAAFFLAHADMPFIEAAHYRAIEAAYAGAGGAATGSVAVGGAAAFGSHDGVRGHPALLPSAWIPAILAIDPRLSLRDFVSLRPLVLVETGIGSLRDIDTPEDYCRALSDDI